MVREIKASLVSHASLIQAMTPNLAAAHSNSGMPDLPSYSAPKSPSMMSTVTHRVPCYCRKGVLQICQWRVIHMWKVTKHVGFYVYGVVSHIICWNYCFIYSMKVFFVLLHKETNHRWKCHYKKFKMYSLASQRKGPDRSNLQAF